MRKVVVLSVGAVLAVGVVASAWQSRQVPQVNGAVLSLTPFGALADYGDGSGTSACAHAIGVQVTQGHSGGTAGTWEQSEQAANAAARQLTGNPTTKGLSGPRGISDDVIVQAGAQAAKLPVPAGEVVLLRDGSLRIEVMPEDLTVGEATDVPMTAGWFPGPLEGDSAGLALALSAVDAFSEGNLCAGGPMAATGTISPDGKVGSVASVREKAILAKRAGMRILVVPMGQGKDAEDAIRDGAAMTVVEAGTLADAVKAVQALSLHQEP